MSTLPKTLLLSLWLCCLVMMAVPLAGAQPPRRAEPETTGNAEQREEQNSRTAVSRRQATQIVSERFEGRILNVRLEGKRWRVRLDNDGTVFNVFVDAQTGAVSR
ncbi:MAG: PepSY domain-containing protein [Pseudomonadales bacterium]|nr:PepSY domain-containing protein [Pseudomonadales bacterium]